MFSTTLPESMSEKIISEKIAEWEEQRARQKALRKLEDIHIHPFVAISRDLGCGEEAIIPKLEQALGWQVYGRNLLDHIAQRDSLSRNFIETLDEQRQNLVDHWIKFLIRSGTILQDDYVVKISRMMKIIVSHESAILLGRGACYILGDKKPGLRVMLTAPLDLRIKNIASLRNVSVDEAESIVRETDSERKDFITHFFKTNPMDMSHFDVVFNTQNISTDMIVKTIASMMEAKVGSG